MLGVFGRKPGSLVGIDIQSTAVTLLALSRQGPGYRVEAYARETLPPGVLQERLIVDPEALAQTLSRVRLKSGTGLRNVAVALPGEAVISKLIEMPVGLSEQELEDQVALEAEQYIPYPLEDVAIDFEVQGPVPGSPQRNQVLLVACHNEHVESLVSALVLADLSAEVVETQPLALERCLALLGSSQSLAPQATLALFDIGLDRSTFNVMQGQRVIHGHEQPFGSRRLLDDLQGHGLTLEEVLLAQRQERLPQDCIGEVLHAFEEELVQQAARSLQEFAGSSQRRQVDLLLLAGSASRLHGLAQCVEQSLAVVTCIANPFRDMSSGAGVDARGLADQAPSLLLACGLALRGVR
ncbi:type IV pilus assembly protein PilM [Pseudomonas sp. MSSRFD41]|uniref:type IV pilus assembly protein PilM n=1 Tax=Pseudomonas sp. MSSRFD41 TaxID=1310370 RepID=UPI001639AFD8|nr:type IV pilus assembly protein PilM [Pseudomonas sp. MSSRFD41]MBC2654715.1 type IV pilus assembly protein PilM [Pseudomonas sp. MSSRFD41]